MNFDFFDFLEWMLFLFALIFDYWKKLVFLIFKGIFV